MTTRTPKLSDMQLILLATACQRDDGSLLPPPESIGSQADRVRKAVTSLIKRSLAEEIEVTDAARCWREEGDRRLGVVVTDAGRAIIAAEEAEAPVATEPAAAPQPQPDSSAPAATPQRPATKIALVLDLLQGSKGATLAELSAAAGWLPHTTRAALTGLRKKGHAIVIAKQDGVTRYAIADPRYRHREIVAAEQLLYGRLGFDGEAIIGSGLR